MKLSKELKIGAFVIIVLVLTFFTINFLRGKDVFNREVKLVARFENVAGLTASAPVNIRGFKAGSVTDVEYDRETDMFVVTCSVKKKFMIPEDSRLVIYSTDIMGTRGTRIEAGSSVREVKNGSELKSGIEKDLIASVTDGIAPVMDGLVSLLGNLNSLMGNVNSMIDEENKANVKTLLADARRTVSNLRSFSSSLENKSPEIEKFIDSLEELSSRLSGVMETADSTMAEVGGAVASVKESELFDMISSLNGLLRKIQDPEGTFGRMIKDDTIYDSVDSLVNNVNDLVKKMQENPKKYMKISVF